MTDLHSTVVRQAAEIKALQRQLARQERQIGALIEKVDDLRTTLAAERALRDLMRGVPIGGEA